MNLKEIKELIEFLKEQEIAEFELERGDVKVRIKRAPDSSVPPQDTRIIAVQTPAPLVTDNSAIAATSPPAATPPKEPTAKAEEPLHTVRSPIVGTFYESPSPGSPPFVKPGDVVEVGQVLCIVEAMKLMNEIESDVAGEVVKRLVANGQPIEYGQELFAIRPKT
ncbi:MAG TPA: acetyl-CoA carboxylase biotin carboxyl carrier protein [Terriglobales bacterium]|nr:acetyl-CoA carboxylase biotin carboxyl carrier protein [Terriglobales bacterium]